MKYYQVLLFAIVIAACCISGCTLGDVYERGDNCPQGIQYIHSEKDCTEKNKSECHLEFEGVIQVFDFSKNFDLKQCPWQFPVCRGFGTGSDIVYACEENVKSKEFCVEGELECRSDEDDDKVVCINPANNKTCGAHYCNAEGNYGAMNCVLNDASCQNLGFGKYGCVRGNIDDDSMNIICSDAVVDPSSPETCGASDCSQPNYGGTLCSRFESCRKGDNYYQCRSIECDGNLCLFTDEDGFPACGNSKNKCGSLCDNCLSLHQNGVCLDNGVCAISECFENEKPVFDGDVIVKCNINS